MAAGEAPARIIMAMERTPVGGDTTWDWIAPSDPAGVTDAAWVTLSGSYTFADPAEGLNLYLESDSATAAYYIDDIVIVMTAEPPTQEVNIFHGFEDGTTQGWAARYGFGVVENSTEVAHGGTHSLKMSGRTANWHAPILDIRDVVTVGVQYDVSVWARLALTETTTDMRVSVEFKPAGIPTSTYQTVINNAPVSPDGWTQFAGKYTLAQEVDYLTIYLETASAPTATFYIDDFSFSNTSHPPIQTDIPSVYETYASDFIVGAALETDGIASTRHEQLTLKHFNSVTAGNAMKPGPIHPSEDVYNWTNADMVANFARDNGLYVHGHTLVWHSQAAEWMFKDANGDPLEATPQNKQLLLDRMEAHIRTVVPRYNDVVNVWDVVNEVIDPAEDDCLRRSEWYRLAGTDYISVAFQIAREMAPTATLILNDYGETSPAKRQCMYDVVKNLQDQGVPIDGIGMQMHINIQNPTVAAIEETIEMFAELGEVHITELDMSIYPNDTDRYTTVPPEVLIKQGYRYKAIFEALRRQGAAGTGNLQSVTFWGLADDATWLTWHPIERINLPLLFDEELQAKHAYWGIIDPSRLPVFVQEQFVSRATPVLDGATETLWDMLPWIEIPAAGDLAAAFQARWDEDYLYVIVDVQDATTSTEDMVEIFVDQNNAKTTTYQNDDLHYTFPSQTMMLHYVITPNDQGYVLEARIPVSVALASGARLGFDLRVTDSSQPTEPISWNDPTHSQNTNPSQFGTLILIDELRLTTAIQGTPVIDGRWEALWTSATEIETAVWVTGRSGATAKVRTLWDEDHLYIYAVVSDTLLSKASANAWEEDSIEVFIDQNNSKAASYEPDDGQFRVNFDNEPSFNGAAASADTLTSATWIIPADQTVLLDGTYVVEAAISLTHVTPAPGVFIGFDFQVNNDEDGNGARDSVVVWNDPTGQSYQNTSRLGVLQFITKTFELTVETTGTGSGTVMPVVGTHTYPAGAQVVLTATAAAGSEFVGWGGDASGTDATTVVVMDSDKTAVAAFNLADVCVDVTDVTLTRLTTGNIYPGTEVQFRATIAPATAIPYTYTVDYGAGPSAPVSTVNNPLTFSHTFATTGTKTVTFAAWNCEMTVPLTDMAQLTVLAPAPTTYLIYLPLVMRAAP